MSDIFISYKREEQPQARKLADALQKKGWTVWWDPEIRAGERFDDVIEKALIESKCVVVLWSKLSVESQYVKDEATYALNRDKLVPILIEEVNLPFRFERINTGQLIDWDGSDKFPGFQKLIADVISILGEPPVEEEKRKREQAEREAEKERRRKQEAERKRREDEQRKAEEERQRLEEEKQRLAEEKRKFEEEQKRIEAARKAEEERKQEEERKRKAEEEKRRKEQEELKRKAEEERKRTEAEAERKAEEERKKKEFEAKRREKKATIKPDKSEPVKIKLSEPHKTSNVLKFGVLAGVAVLLIAGIWWWVSQQQVKEYRQEIEKLDRQALNLENAVAELDKPEQIEEFTKQRDTLSRQVESLIEQATKVGLKSQLSELKDRLKKAQIQLAKKEKEFKDKEFVKVRQKIEKLNGQALDLENAISELDKPEQIKEFTSLRDTLSRQIEGLIEQAAKVGLESQLEQLQNRLEQIQIQLANKEKEFIEVRQEIEKLDRHALNLENAVVEADNQALIKGLYEQRDTLSHQIEGFVEKATKVGLKSQLEQIQYRLKQIQIQLTNKEKDLIAARKGKIFVATAPDNATVKILNVDEPFRQGIELAPGKYHVQVSSEGYEPQERWIEIGAGDERRINFELITISPKVGRLFVETYPKDATVGILNIKQKFFQGMELKPGRYNVEVATEGYETGRRWIDLVAGHEEPFKFELAEIKTTEPNIHQKVITNRIGMKFVLIPAGRFRMGGGTRPEEVIRRYGGKVDYFIDEYPQHKVIIDYSYYLQTTPVTVGQWRKFIDSNKEPEPAWRKQYCSNVSDRGWRKDAYWDNPSFKQNDRHPVTCVGWTYVERFIDWLNEIEGKSIYRLPSEAEWEYACRAGTSTEFSFGDDASKLATYAWFIKNSNSRTHPVASKRPNPWGLYDMHGNVWEWVQDHWHENYNGAPSDGSPWTVKIYSNYRVLRGGSWFSSLSNVRSASRSWHNDGTKSNNLGFRVARSIIPAP